MAAKPAQAESLDRFPEPESPTDVAVSDESAVIESPVESKAGGGHEDAGGDSHDQPTRKRLIGLTSSEVIARRERGDGNTAPQGTSRTYRRILFENAFTLVNTILFAIVIFLVVLGLYGDAFMTAILVVANVVIGVFQEARAKHKLDRIALLTRPIATTIRDGREQQIDPRDIVRGDLLVLRPGDQVLVDGSVVQDGGMSVDESLLTGESDLIPKRVGDMVFSGSFCMTGSGVYEAERVGTGSMAQEITDQARAYRDVKTPLQREVGLAIRVMLLLMIALGVQVADTFRQIYNDVPLTESVKAAAVVVALVPQGLVFMVTVTYALAAVRISGKGALIQRMNAVESTSQINVLCLDKTGTLTTNQLAVQTVEPLASSVTEDKLRSILGDIATSASSSNKTSDAIKAACGGRERPVRAEVPFSSARKWSALAFDDAAYVLGAPEMLRRALADSSSVDIRIDEWTSQGLRVLLVARSSDPAVFDTAGDDPQLPEHLEPIGMIAISDQLRPEARETISGFARAGIALKIISGDNPDTVAALAKQAGFGSDIQVISGLELDALSEEEFHRVAHGSTIFGRITPEQKERLIRALRDQKGYVAMIGDGVNDVLALKQAHLAIAMRSGSQVTRSVADIVLMEDSFAVLPQAFREGQRILKGMQDIIRLFLVRAIYVALIIFGVNLLGEPFPVTPKQNALLALLTVGIPVFFLAGWAKPGVTPRRLIPSSGHFVLPAAVSIAVVGLTIYQFFVTMTNDLEMARTALTITTVLCGLTLIPFLEPPTESWAGGDEHSGDWRPTFLAAGLLVAFLVALFIEPVRDFYELESLPFSSYVLITIVVVGWATIVRYLWRLNLVVRTSDWSIARWRGLHARLHPSHADPATADPTSGNPHG